MRTKTFLTIPVWLAMVVMAHAQSNLPNRQHQTPLTPEQVTAQEYAEVKITSVSSWHYYNGHNDADWLEVSGTVQNRSGVKMDFIAFNADKKEIARENRYDWSYNDESFKVVFVSVPSDSVKFVKAVASETN